MSATIRIRVAGWSYSDWRGIVYPYPEQSRFVPLLFLTGYFDTIEINSSFYRIPTKNTVASWVGRDSINPEFRFTWKIYRRFTHERLFDPEDEYAAKEALAQMIDEQLLGALLMQFPLSFQNTPDERKHLKSLLRCFSEYPLVVEVRHSSWNQPDVYNYLVDNNVGFCNINQPQIGLSLPATNKVTSPVGYIRLHGRNYRNWFREDAKQNDRYDYLTTTTNSILGLNRSQRWLYKHQKSM